MVQDSPGVWKVTAEDKEYETPVFTLFKRIAQHPEGMEGTFYVVDTPDWVNVVAITPDEKIILIDQYRHGMQAITTEIPGGMVDPGETPLESAQRELLEETGYRAQEWIEIGLVEANPAIMHNRTYSFLALGCQQVQDQETDKHEEISIHTYDASAVFSLIDDGTIRHALVVAALAHYQRWLEHQKS
jgi:8-oxo-dGTP pyrophosphatase MutT (NUDIX family)